MSKPEREKDVGAFFISPRGIMAYTSTASGTALGQSVLARFYEFAANRTVLEEKWERNYEDFHRISREGEEWKKGEGKTWRSGTFIGVTYQKVMAAYAIILDAILTGGALPFMLKVDDAFDAMDAGGEWESVLEDYKKKLESVLEDTDAERAFKRVLLSALIYGEGWSKRKVRGLEKKRWAEVTDAAASYFQQIPQQMRRFERVTEQAQAPTFEHVPVQQMFWDMEATDLADASAVIQRTYVSPWRLRQMSAPWIDPEAVKKAIADVPKGVSTPSVDQSGAQLEPRLRNMSYRNRMIRLMEYWGRVSRKEIEAYEQRLGMETDIPGIVAADDESGDEIEALVLMAGDEVIGAVRTSPEDRPFGRMLAGEDLDDAGGIGIPDKLEATARVINGIVRAFEDNKRLTANLILVKKPHALQGKNQAFTPGTDIQVTSDVERIDDAVKQLTFQDVGDTLISALNIFMSLAEEESAVPALAQGLPDPGQRDSATATEITERASKSQKYMGTVIGNADEDILEPNLTWMLDFLMEQDAAGPRPLHVQALGFNSFMNRIVRLQKLQQFLAIVLGDQELRTRYKVWEIADEIARMMDLDPEKYEYSEEEMAAQAAAMQAQQMAQAAPKPGDEAKVAETQSRAVLNEAQAQKTMTEAQMMGAEMGQAMGGGMGGIMGAGA